MANEVDPELFHGIQRFLREARNPQLPNHRFPVGEYFNKFRIKAIDFWDGWNMHTKWAMIQIQGTINWQGKDRLVVDKEYYQGLLDDENTLAAGELLTGVVLLGGTGIIKNPFFRALTLLGGTFFVSTAYAHRRNVRHAQRLLDNAQAGDN